MQENTSSALQLPADINEAEVLLAELIAIGVPWVIKAVGALVILVIGLIVASWIKGTIRKLIEKSGRVDATLSGFLSSLAYYVALAIVFVMVLGNFGIQTTSLAALLGAAGLAIGLALQGTLGHVASGVMLLAFRPFNVGDYVIAGGQEGSVTGITLFTTEMATPDNKKIIIPNGKIWDNTITNFSANARRRLDMVFGISYDDDIGKARTIIMNLIEEDPRIHEDPAPIVEVNALGDYSVDFTVRMWLDKAHFFQVKWEMNRKVKEAFDRENITIPFPTAIEYQVDMPKP